MTLEDQISIEIINFDKLRLSFDREWKLTKKMVWSYIFRKSRDLQKPYILKNLERVYKNLIYFR